MLDKWKLLFLILFWRKLFCSGTPLTPFIKNFAPVYYNKDSLTEIHHITKRSPQKRLQLKFSAYDRLFELELYPDVSIFTSDALIETGSETVIEYDRSKTYVGHLRGKGNNTVHGIVTEDGLFNGKITTEEDEFVVEPASTYFPKTREDDVIDFDSVIYKTSDVTLPKDKLQCGYKDQTKQFNEHLSRGGSKNFHEKRKKRYTSPRTCCTLFVVADHTFVQKHGSVHSTLDNILLLIQDVNLIFKSIDFDEDGSQDNITFAIKHIKIHTAESLLDSNYLLTGFHRNAEDYLYTFAGMGEYDDYCLAVLLSNQDFDEGILGLAWMGSLDYGQIGGICQKSILYDGKLRSFNSLVVTTQSGSTPVPYIKSTVTLAHELGHSFGASHDGVVIKECAPDEESGGYFLMYMYAVDGTQPNNKRFSPCSIEDMKGVVSFDGKSFYGCFIEPPLSICGNGIVEGDEECDCGSVDDCYDDCCYPMSDNQTFVPCTLKPGAVCSPTASNCCSKKCRFFKSKHNVLCSEETVCADAAYCQYPFKLYCTWISSMYSLTSMITDGGSCPVPEFKHDGTKCTDDMMCYQGSCSHSVCEAYGLHRCQCKKYHKKTTFSALDVRCHLCCSVDRKCRSSFFVEYIPDGFSQPGHPCNDYKGYCNNEHICIEVEPQYEVKRTVVTQLTSSKLLLILLVPIILIPVSVGIKLKKYAARIAAENPQNSQPPI
ncbi:disintegrin and metalloproteinase domain-containing protein 10-like [Glandiceps talaboti]